MVKRAVNSYKDSFRGLSIEIWWLALITFINRAGTMVLPFLSLYLTEDLNLTLAQVGWIMSCFGVGSLLGSWLGGKLTDSIGYYKVMFWSLLVTGFLFIGLQYISTFYGFAIGIFLTMTVADSFRPAMFVALSAYSKPENKTRSVTLIRLAINLGFSIGPAIGGFLIFHLGYAALFWVDGITCGLAMILMLIVIKNTVKLTPEDKIEQRNLPSVYSDRSYLWFIAGLTLFAFGFLQYFSTVPYYYATAYHLPESEIGLLLGFNGLLIFIIEMPIIHYLEKKNSNALYYIFIGSILLFLSFVIFLLGHSVSLLWIGINEVCWRWIASFTEWIDFQRPGVGHLVFDRRPFLRQLREEFFLDEVNLEIPQQRFAQRVSML